MSRNRRLPRHRPSSWSELLRRRLEVVCGAHDPVVRISRYAAPAVRGRPDLAAFLLTEHEGGVIGAHATGAMVEWRCPRCPNRRVRRSQAWLQAEVSRAPIGRVARFDISTDGAIVS